MRTATLAISMLTVTSLIASSGTLSDAFKNGKVDGNIQAFYIGFFNSSNSDAGGPPGKNGDNRNQGAVGGNLGFTTGKYHGFHARINFNTTNSMGILRPTKTYYQVGSLDPDYTYAQEVYLSYAYSKTTVKAGRMALFTPLATVADDTRISQGSFGAIVGTNKDIPDTTIILGQITSTAHNQSNPYIANRPSSNNRFVSMSDAAGVDKYVGNQGVTLAAIINKSISGLTLQAWNYYASNMLDAIYLQANYNTKVNNKIGLFFAGQYIGENGNSILENKMNKNISSNYYGLKTGIKFEAATATVAYSKTGLDKGAFQDGGLFLPWGGSWVTLFTSTMEIIPALNADTRAWQIRGDYNFHDIVHGLTAMARYANYQGNSGVSHVEGRYNSTELDIDSTYAITKAFSVRVRFSRINDLTSANADFDELRIQTVYKF